MSGAGPLEGLTVLEVGAVVAGPFATRMLGDLGAEVVKVETPKRPDEMRAAGRGRIDGRGLWWPVQTRNKRLVTIDLSRAEGQELFLELAAAGDVLVENLRPGRLESWNLGPDRLQATNPRLIVARISGFGQTGPYAGRPAYAAIGEAVGGLRYVNGFPDRPQPRFGVSLGDSLAALFAVQAILSALVERERSGLGQVVDVSIAESCFAMLEGAAPEFDRLGLVREPTGSRIGGVSPSNLFEAGDGMRIVVGAHQDAIFQRLCGAIGRPELAVDPRFETHAARVEHQDALESIIAAWVLERTGREAVEQLNAAAVAAGPVYSIADIFEDPHYRAREALVVHHDEELGDFVGPGLPFKLSRTPGGIRWSGRWRPGSDNRDVLLRLPGMNEERLESLVEDGVV